jgi:hypothetical protein
MARKEKIKDQSADDLEARAYCVALGLGAARRAPNKQMAKALLEALIQGGWGLNERLPKHVESDLGYQGLTAADVSATGGRSGFMAQALGELGVNWAAAPKGELSAMSLAANNGNWEALEAMSQSGGDWLGRSKTGRAAKPANAPIDGVWRPSSRASASRHASNAVHFARVGALRKASWTALESAVELGVVEPGPWVAQVGASLLSHGDGEGGWWEPQSEKLWGGFVERCAALGWRLDGELEPPRGSSRDVFLALGLSGVERPNVALALAIRAGSGTPGPLIQALAAGVMDLDPRSAWALANGALGQGSWRTHAQTAPGKAIAGLAKAVEALAPWGDQLRACQSVAVESAPFDNRAPAELDGMAQLCAALLLPEDERSSYAPTRAREVAPAARLLAGLLPSLGFEPGKPGWEDFSRLWAEKWADASGPKTGGWRRFSWLGVNEAKASSHKKSKDPACPPKALQALGSLALWSTLGDGPALMAREALSAWARAEELRASEKKVRIDESSLSSWALKARAMGLARGPAAQALLGACSARLAAWRAPLDAGWRRLESTAALLEGEVLSQEARPTTERKKGVARL